MMSFGIDEILRGLMLGSIKNHHHLMMNLVPDLLDLVELRKDEVAILYVWL